MPFTLEPIPKIAKATNKEDVKSICVRIIKHARKRSRKSEISQDWLWTIAYDLFWLYIYMYKRFKVYMIPLFLAAHAQETFFEIQEWKI